MGPLDNIEIENLLTFRSRVHRCHLPLNHIITFAKATAFDDCTDIITIWLRIIIN